MEMGIDPQKNIIDLQKTYLRGKNIYSIHYF